MRGIPRDPRDLARDAALLPGDHRIPSRGRSGRRLTRPRASRANGVRILCLGLDGADYDLVRELARAADACRRSRGSRSVARSGRFARRFRQSPRLPGPRSLPDSTRPGTASSTSRRTRTGALSGSKAPRAAPGSHSGAVSAGAGVRSAFVSIPFTYPAETIEASSLPATAAREAADHSPDGSRTHPRGVSRCDRHHPMGERWWEDFEGIARRLVEHVDETAGICRLASSSNRTCSSSASTS